MVMVRIFKDHRHSIVGEKKPSPFHRLEKFTNVPVYLLHSKWYSHNPLIRREREMPWHCLVGSLEALEEESHENMSDQPFTVMGDSLPDGPFSFSYFYAKIQLQLQPM